MRKIEYQQLPLRNETVDAINLKLEEAATNISQVNDRINISVDRAEIRPEHSITILTNRSWKYGGFYYCNFDFTVDENKTITDYTAIASLDQNARLNEVFSTNGLYGIVRQGESSINICHTTLSKGKTYTLAFTLVI